MAVEYECCTSGFFIHIVVIVLLVLFAGLMSGLTLGLMSMSLVDLEVLAKSGTPKDRKHAGTASDFDFGSEFWFCFVLNSLFCLAAGKMREKVDRKWCGTLFDVYFYYF